jgi:hypothetical protein
MNENDVSVDPAYIGLSEGAINYYKSIGKAKYFLTIKDIQTYAQQGDFSIFDSVEETNIGLKLCYLNLKRQVYLIKPNGEIIGDTGFKEIYPHDNVFEVQNKNNYLYSFVIPVGNDYKLITDEYGEELWFDKIKSYYNDFTVTYNDNTMWGYLIPVSDGRDGKYKIVSKEEFRQYERQRTSFNEMINRLVRNYLKY